MTFIEDEGVLQTKTGRSIGWMIRRAADARLSAPFMTSPGPDRSTAVRRRLHF